MALVLSHVPSFRFSLDPLIAEAKRRARQRRVLAATVLLAGAGAATGAALALRSSSGAGVLSGTTGSIVVVGLGHPLASAIDQGPCPQGRWSQAIYATADHHRIGTMYGCGLSISKGNTARLDPAWIRQTARERFVLPGGSITAVCHERFQWRDAQDSRATFRCRVHGGGTIRGAGKAVDGRADYLLRISRTGASALVS